MTIQIPDPKWQEQSDAIAAAYSAAAKEAWAKSGVPPVDQTKRGLAIPGMARELVWTAPDAPRKTMPPKKALVDLGRASERLLQILEILPPEVIPALRSKPADLADLDQVLRTLSWRAAEAEFDQKLGPPMKVQPAAIAKMVADHYHRLTGKKPTVPKRDGKSYGPFPELLKRVFEILEVKAKPISQAEKIARSWQPAHMDLRHR